MKIPAFFLNEKGRLTVTVLFACCLSACLKYEVMWDFINYHYYNAFSFLNGRMMTDIAPAAVLTYFNPLLDVITYCLVNIFNENVTLYYFVCGIPYGLCLYAFLSILKQFFDLSSPTGKIQAGTAFAIAATGYATFSQIGTMSHELTVSFFVLTAFHMIVKAVFDDETPAGKPFLIAGILLGAAAGLKLTAALYCVTVGMSVLCFWRRLKNPGRQVGFLIAGGLTGFLITNGFWMVLLTKWFGNPVFPLFNRVFRSPFFIDENFKDVTYLEDRTPLQTFLLPFIMIAHFKENFVAGADFSDARFAVAYVAGFVFLFHSITAKICKKTSRMPPRDAFLICFAAITYFLWLFGSSVIRYAVPLEMMFAVLIVKALFSLPRRSFFSYALSVSATVFVCGILIASPFFTDPWGSKKGDDFLMDFEQITVPDGTLVLLYGQPMAALAVPAAKNADVRILGYTRPAARYNRMWNFADTSELGRRREKIVAEHKGGVIAFIKKHPNYVFTLPENVKKMQCRLPKRRFVSEEGRSKSDLFWPYTVFCWSDELKDRFGEGKPAKEFVKIPVILPVKNQ